MIRFLYLFVFVCVVSSLASAETVLITGANRGIGFELSKQFSEKGWDVIATSRSPGDDTMLQKLATSNDRVLIEYLDVTDHAGIDALANKLAGTPIDILINNAATTGGVLTDTLGNLNYAPAWLTYNVNAIGPLKVSEAFVDHVAASEHKMIIMLNGDAGSIGKARGKAYIFGASKAALSMFVRKLSLDVKERGITVTVVAPGFVDTMGFTDGTYSEAKKPDFKWLYDLYKKGFAIPTKTDETVARIIPFILNLDIEKSGLWLNLDGDEVPW